MTTARDIALDADGDWDVSGGDLVLVYDGAAILQAISIALRFFKGEWFLNTEAGLAYYQSVLVKNPDPTVLQSIFSKAILAVEGVTAINDLSLSLDTSTRTLSVSFRVATDAGLLSSTVTL